MIRGTTAPAKGRPSEKLGGCGFFFFLLNLHKFQCLAFLLRPQKPNQATQRDIGSPCPQPPDFWGGDVQGMAQPGLSVPGPTWRHPRWSPEPGRAAPGCSIPHLRGGCEELMVFKKREGSHQPGTTRPLQKPLGAPQGWPRSPLPFLGRAALFFSTFLFSAAQPISRDIKF